MKLEKGKCYYRDNGYDGTYTFQCGKDDYSTCEDWKECESVHIVKKARTVAEVELAIGDVINDESTKRSFTVVGIHGGTIWVFDNWCYYSWTKELLSRWLVVEENVL